jgi:nitroreductase
MNQVLKAIRDRWSVRRSDHALAEIRAAGHWAPSGKNTQPWRFVVVRSGGKRRALARLAPQGRMIATAPAAKDTEELAALIPIGRPGEAPIPPDRFLLTELVRYI